MSIENAETSELESGFALTHALSESVPGQNYDGPLEVLYMAPEGSWADHFIVLGVILHIFRKFGEAFQLLLLFPRGTLTDNPDEPRNP